MGFGLEQVLQFELRDGFSTIILLVRARFTSDVYSGSMSG